MILIMKKDEKKKVEKEEIKTSKLSSMNENQLKKIEWNKKALTVSLILLGLILIVFTIVMILINSGSNSSPSCDGGGTCPINFISLR